MNTRSMIFTLYGDYIRHYGSEIWIGSLIRLLKEFGHHEQSVRVSISRMMKQGWVQVRKEGNRSYYSLTERGVERIDEAAHRIFKFKPDEWDGKWRMLIYTIPEEKRNLRDELRKELVWSGFGTITNSCWVSPNDLTRQVFALMDAYDIRPYVHYFETEYKGPAKSEELVHTGWDIEAINEKYDKFIQKYSKKYVLDKSDIQSGKKSDAVCFVERTNLVHEYRKFLFSDPGLPEELLPEKWLGTHAATLFADYYRLLAKPASRFFESVFVEDDQVLERRANYDVMHHPLMTD
ncbi:phenylacetic acid degradation operon negative regulatory protein PaaX [Bacillus fonticola]|uniref:phenylacetic acid degradation operon negative regulatory protein PaaX n=1 Tax=Bacillus fonticola TaxID=2728853 RepID=UPI001473A746|nr:phenylacetic acid degradation operon negative regulatory protein PaaX [Bacillus fonticola]